MDLRSAGETSGGAFDSVGPGYGSDAGVVAQKLFQAAYDLNIGQQPSNSSLVKLLEQSDRRGSDQKLDKPEPPPAVARGNDQTFGDLQGQVPEAYLKYLNEYKDAGGPGKRALPPDVSRVDPAAKPDQPKPSQPKPDQPKPEHNKPQPDQPLPPVPDKILPGPKPLPAPRPEVKPAPRPNPGINPEPNPQPSPQPAPRPCPRPG